VTAFRPTVVSASRALLWRGWSRKDEDIARMTPANLPDLPVSQALRALADALDRGNRAVLVAPPGAGKTTIVPPTLLEATWRGDGAILLLEPRRIAARAAARRMASFFGEDVGETVGYSMRLDQRKSARTRILVVTEGLLTRMILDDPELPGIAGILFDEFHERSLDADFGLALALDVQGALRPDLRILVMSATLDGAKVARLLGAAPVIESEGRSFPVEIRYRERPAGAAIEDAMADTVRALLAEEEGSILAFLPGQREIERTGERLQGRVAANVDVVPLFGQMDAADQDAAVRPAPAGRRKVVLATTIAETSLTIDGIRVVVDSGLSRAPRYEPASGLTRLETTRVSRAAADQRAGRAGRTGPGIAVRMWRAEQNGSLAAFATPEILEADLSGLLLDCAAFGVADPRRLAFLDPPPTPALSEARALLATLGALDADGRLTETGNAMRRMALPARLARMVAVARDRLAAGQLAVLLSERGLGGDTVDLDTRLQRFRADRSARADAARRLASRFADRASGPQPSGDTTAGELLLLAWPDRVAKARGERGRFLLANGGGATLDANDPLAGARYLVVADLGGNAQVPRIMAAAAVDEQAIRTVLGDRIVRQTDMVFDAGRRALRAFETVRLGALTLSETTLAPPNGPQADAALLAALRQHGLSLLNWNGAPGALRARLAWLHATVGEPWPDMSDAALLQQLDHWLAPYLTGEPSLTAIGPEALCDGLRSLVPDHQGRQIEALAPSHYEAPSGSRVPIRYEANGAVLPIRVQELFGLSIHPAIAGGRVPLTLELLSPAHRPIQTTRDLPGFWRGSWAEVRAALRGRYPRHPWPDDPLAAEATNRAKPRGK